MMNYPEFDICIAYMREEVVWFGELSYVSAPTLPDFCVAGEIPDESKNWKVYWRGG